MAQIKAIIFDQDGVIIDTERDGHRVAFNKTFEEFGFDVHWDVGKYHEMLQVGGGKERMRYHLHKEGFGAEIAPDREDALIRALHKRKTDIFIEMIEGNRLPLRPGVRRMMRQVMQQGLILGICTTSNERAAGAIVGKVLKDIQFDFVLAGDIVKNKKPDPEIYLLALKRCGLTGAECIVFEDSGNGVNAARGAGMNVVATVNEYTQNEDLSGADIVLTCLGDADSEQAKLIQSKKECRIDGVVGLSDLIEYFQ